MMRTSSSSARWAVGLFFNQSVNVPATRFLSTNKENHQKNLLNTPEEGYYRVSSYEPVALPNLPLDKYIWSNYRKWEKLTATVCCLTDRQYTFAQLRDASAALAVRLQTKFNLGKGDVAAVCLPNTPEFPIAVLGAIEAGLTVTTMNPIYTSEEIARQLLASGAKFIICSTLGYPVIKEACEKAKVNIPICCLRMTADAQLPAGAIDFFELIRTDDVDFSQLKEYDINPDDVVLLPFSSGTTGLPKGVMLSHNNIAVNCEQTAPAIPINTMEHQETVPGVLPFFHIYGITYVMFSKLFAGCKLVTMPQFKPEDLLKSLSVYKGSILSLVPPIILFMTNHPMMTPEKTPAMRYVMSGAAPISGADVERFLKKFPQVKFLQGYGLTETSPVVLYSPSNNKRFAAAGMLAPNTEAKIVETSGQSDKGVGPNITGELCVRGPQVFKGYLNNEEATKETFFPRNWMRTGDVGHYDEEGYFYLTDRMKELIKVKGFQVPPAELEGILREHPKILEAAVFGVPHEINGEAPRALVVLKPGMEATVEEIYNFVAERVAVYKKLEGGIMFGKEVPKNPTGKILRKELKEKYSSV